MGVGFDTPLGGLALEMAYRNEQARKKAAEQNAYEQSLVNKRLQQYGGDIKDYQDVWNRGYGGAQQAAQAQASALRDYWVGLPEAMIAVAREGQQTGGGGTSTTVPTTPQLSIEDILRRAGIIPPVHLQGTLIRPSYTNPDTAEARFRVQQTGRPVQARRVTPQMGR